MRFLTPAPKPFFSEMRHLLRVALLSLLLLAGQTLARNGCRRCQGTLTITFKEFVTSDEVREYVAGTIGTCATGKQYDIVRGFQKNCVTANFESSCKTFILDVKVWRYCGNGAHVLLKQNNVCVGQICMDSEALSLNCDKSVDCADTCHCNLCAC